MTPPPPSVARGDAVLLTGASGFLGGEVLRRLLERTEREVVALGRREPGAAPHPRLRCLTADLAVDDVPELPREITTVVHCAAAIAFDMPLDEQRAINVEGTRKLLAAVGGLPDLERVAHVSTAYVAGTHEGVFGPDDLDRGQGFRNAYEQSKNEAEHLVRASGLPVQVLRPSIVVGDQHDGRTPAFNVMYPPLRAYARGRLPFLGGRAEAPLDVVPVDHVADGLLALLAEPAGGTHLLVAGEHETSVGELAGLAHRRFGHPPIDIMSPERFEETVAPLREDPKAARVLDASAPLMRYYDVRSHFRDPATDAILAGHGLQAPPLPTYFDVLMDYAERASWGREQAVAA